MKIVINFLLLLSLLASTCIHANSQPGEKEYLAAIDIRDKIISLMEQYEEDGNAQAPDKKQAIRSSLSEYAPKYNEQLKTSSDLGFPPAQFLYAQALKEQAIHNTEKRIAIKTEACTLLEQAANKSLLAAAVGATSYCSDTSDAKDFGAIMKAREKILMRLAKDLDSEDQYAIFYPLKGFTPIVLWTGSVRSSQHTRSIDTPAENTSAYPSTDDAGRNKSRRLFPSGNTHAKT